jgi:hypothetical protein
MAVAIKMSRYPALRLPLQTLQEAVLLVGGYGIYLAARTLIGGRAPTVAFDHADHIIWLENALRLTWADFHLQQWALNVGHDFVRIFNVIYIFAFWPIIWLSALLYYIFDRPRYRYYRSLLLLTLGIALIGFLVYPLAPPRMMAGRGFVDTLLHFGPDIFHSRIGSNYANVFAAIPSLHFGWALMFGILFWRTGPLWLKPLGVLYPTMMFFAITITGNHYVLDAVAGGLVLLAAYLVYERLIRPGHLQRACAAAVRGRSRSGPAAACE